MLVMKEKKKYTLESALLFLILKFFTTKLLINFSTS